MRSLTIALACVALLAHPATPSAADHAGAHRYEWHGSASAPARPCDPSTSAPWPSRCWDAHGGTYWRTIDGIAVEAVRIGRPAVVEVAS